MKQILIADDHSLIRSGLRARMLVGIVDDVANNYFQKRTVCVQRIMRVLGKDQPVAIRVEHFLEKQP